MTDLDRLVHYGYCRGHALKIRNRVPSYQLARSAIVRHFRAAGRFAVERRTGHAIVMTEYDVGHEASAVIALAHELGHAEQLSSGWRPSTADSIFDVEADAWERGLRILGEVGIVITSEQAEFALACLSTYASYATSLNLTADYLFNLAYGRVI
jgi:hypothetical protein